METSSNYQLLKYLIKFAYPKYNPYCFLLYMFKYYWDIAKQQQVFTLQAVSDSVLYNIGGDNVIWDIDNTIVVDSETKYRKIKYIIVSEGLNNTIKRKVDIIARPINKKFVAFLNFNLCHNLKGATTCRFLNCNSKNLEFADEVELSLINTTNEWREFTIDCCLKEFFTLPKILHQGDVIAVSLKKYGSKAFYATSQITNIGDKIYFKCNKIIYMGKQVDGGYLCSVEKSDLKQVSNIQSYIPNNYYKENKSLDLYDLCPSALDTYFNDIKKAVCPFIGTGTQTFKPVFLIMGHKGSGKNVLLKCIALYFGMHLHTISNFDVSGNAYAHNETNLRNIFFGVQMAAPSILQINNFENFGKNNEGQYDQRLINHFANRVSILFEKTKFPVILFCCSNEKDIPVELKRIFLKTFEIRAPNDQEREKMLKWILNKNEYRTSANLTDIANKTHGFLFEDLQTLIYYAQIAFYKETKNQEANKISERFFNSALDLMQSNYSESLGAPKVPQVKWSDVGGLSVVKEEIVKTIKLPLKYPQLLKATGLKRSGILLFGPPGTGKTLIAKAIATECGLCFLSIKGPELLNMYVGQSEHNVREVFEKARDVSPCIIFFDELDSLAPNRGAVGDSGGAMDRVVSQLLSEMDGLNQTATIFIIGATNRPDLIDPALLRPGRFDKLLYVGPCIDADSKIAVLSALTRKFNLENDSVLKTVVDLCPENCSGADLYGICSNAWMSAVRRLVQFLDRGDRENIDIATFKDVVVTEEDFKIAVKNIQPSISQEDLSYFHKLKSDFK